MAGVMDERDHLTELFARAAFDRALSSHFAHATADQPAALVMADVDHFKKINDRHGHPAGDAVLKEVARRLRQAIHGKGSAYRYGGEEFAAILPNHTGDEALAVTERARRAVEASPVGGHQASCSFGVAIAPSQASGPDQWLKRADEALYDAKQRGRNLVRLFGEPPPESDRGRQTARKRAELGTLSDEAKEELRLQILRNGRALCPFDGVPLTAHDNTTLNERGHSYLVHCPGCGFDTDLPGPDR